MSAKRHLVLTSARFLKYTGSSSAPPAPAGILIRNIIIQQESIVDTKGMIRQYIVTELIKDKKQANLKDSDSLIESGIVDSLGIMKLIGFLEDKINIQISDDELVPENFSSVDSIAALVLAKQAK